MMLWLELRLAYGLAAKATPKTEAALNEVWSYLRWCRDDYRNDDMWTAIACAFLEHLLDDSHVRDDLPKRITLEEARHLVGYATYFHSADDVDRYLAWFAEVTLGIPAKPFRLKNRLSPGREPS